MTPAEQVLWAALRRSQVDGLSFRRQHPVGSYILDVFCPALKLVVDVDGDIHEQPVDQDAFRTKHLESFGYRVLRVRNNDVLNDLRAVLERTRLVTPEP
ncbi:MAG: endonuclease domain-containing protein [Chloroflexota bacterium]|nr:endonuclease domain-containing protein [Chloroflexota bacterium]